MDRMRSRGNEKEKTEEQKFTAEAQRTRRKREIIEIEANRVCPVHAE
jgi:hypothetical protein